MCLGIGDFVWPFLAPVLVLNQVHCENLVSFMFHYRALFPNAHMFSLCSRLPPSPEMLVIPTL